MITASTRESFINSSGSTVEKSTDPISDAKSEVFFRSTSDNATTLASGICLEINLAWPAPIIPAPIIPTFITVTSFNNCSTEFKLNYISIIKRTDKTPVALKTIWNSVS